MSILKKHELNHTAEFKQRRALNWATLGLTYASMYMARYNFAFANKDLSDTYGFSKTEIGSIITFATLFYGLSAMFNGPLADRIGGRKAMLIGTIGAFGFNIAFGVGAYLGFLGTGTLLLGYFATVWTLNMYFQSYSALAIIKVNSAWFHVSERGVFSAIFGSMIQMGRFGVYALMTIPFVVLLPWQWKFFLPAIFAAFFAFMTFLFVKDTPKDSGLPDFDPQDATSGDTEKVTFSYVAKKVFTNPITITIAIAEFCTGLVRKGFEEWFPRYMQEVQNLRLDNPIFQRNALAIVLAGVGGAFAAGMMSDKLFKARRPPVAFIGYACQIISLTIVWIAPSLDLVIAAFILNSFAISMVHSMLSGTASMDFGGKRAGATAAGLFDGMQYVGGSIMGYGMGYLLDSYGWGVWGPSMIGFAVVGAMLMLKLWNVVPKSKLKGSGH
ncbi:MAG: MFS transporter [Ignavibacteriales bacterium]|nr:MFS transporter [Ignavibacteriales bacterium]